MATTRICSEPLFPTVRALTVSNITGDRFGIRRLVLGCFRTEYRSSERAIRVAALASNLHLFMAGITTGLTAVFLIVRN